MRRSLVHGCLYGGKDRGMPRPLERTCGPRPARFARSCATIPKFSTGSISSLYAQTTNGAFARAWFCDNLSAGASGGVNYWTLPSYRYPVVDPSVQTVRRVSVFGAMSTISSPIHPWRRFPFLLGKLPPGAIHPAIGPTHPPKHSLRVMKFDKLSVQRKPQLWRKLRESSEWYVQDELGRAFGAR